MNNELKTIDETSDRFMEFILRGNLVFARKLVFELFESFNDLMIIYDMVKNALYKVGTLWENNVISVSHEHIATAISEKVMADLFEYFISFVKKVPRSMIGIPAAGETHRIGIRMVCDIFTAHGWEASVFMHNDIERFEKMIEGISVQVICISKTIPSSYVEFEKFIELINKQLPETKIIIGGQGLTSSVVDKIKLRYNNLYYFTDLNYIEQSLKRDLLNPF